MGQFSQRVGTTFHVTTPGRHALTFAAFRENALASDSQKNQLALCQTFAWRPPVADKFADKFKAARSAELPAINQTIKRNAPQSDSKKTQKKKTENATYKREGEAVREQEREQELRVCCLGEIISKHVDCY